MDPHLKDALEVSDTLEVQGGRLHCEQAPLAEVAERFGTPLLVMSEGQLRANARRYREAFSSRWGNSEVLSALKANPNLALRVILNEEDLGCDVFGPAELELALRSGLAGDRISVNGSAKARPLIERAVTCGAFLVIDSMRELRIAIEVAEEVGASAKVRLRLRPDLIGAEELSDLTRSDMTIRQAAARYKLGISEDEFDLVAELASGSEHIDLDGVHIHSGRHTHDLGLRTAVLRSATRTIGRIRKTAGRHWAPNTIDLGGGYAVRRDPAGRGLATRSGRGKAEWAPSVEEYAETITTGLGEALREEGIDPDGVRLLVEPGRSLFGDAGVHLTRVANVKRQGGDAAFTWVETDTSQWFMMHGIAEASRWNAVVVDKAAEDCDEVADLVGCSCTVDRIIPDLRVPSAVAEDDVMAILDMGCYEFVSAGNFNKMPRPGMVLVSGERAEWISPAETMEEVASRDVVPDWLGLDSPVG
ncbi:MAG: hypothetical protein JSS97_00240 [Actinobacteria bacterium]|nr:hypothetical protein [Actinomycetota bacterium]